MPRRPALIALDWGTSNLRASLLGAEGGVLETRSAASGVMALPGGDPGRFAAALMALAGDWIETHRCPLIASGMIGSRQGWREAPYVECPAGLAAVAARLVRVEHAAGTVLHIVPGLSCIGADGQDDVMRGEETQLFGAADQEEPSVTRVVAGRCFILPGTHSKWAWLGEGGSVCSFQTFMTGELYAVLRQHSILGRLMPPGGEGVPSRDAGAFAEGVRLGLAEHASATHLLFTVRTAGLAGRVAPEALPELLSGMLIGIEIGGATRAAAPPAVVLLGEPALCARYEAALDVAGIAHRRAAGDATTRGQWLVARAAGLVEEAGA
ncbi:MAG: 2-dehydro-3-deoxygalactonokinase [Rubrivivax sp.]|nr:2-dehydro-3-deoxygalactonokinase [Rubrivivax sp.]